MANELSTHVRQNRLPNGLLWVGHGLLLVPEAVLLAALLCVYMAFDGPQPAALLAVLLVACFVVRIAALHGARHMLDTGRYRETEMLLQIALLLYPWSADGLALCGMLALARGQNEQAEAHLRRAIVLLPSQATFYVALSNALLEQHRFNEALQIARQAVLLNPADALAHLYLAEAERATGVSAALIEDRLHAGLDVSVLPEETAALQCSLAGHLLSERRMAEAMLALHSAEALLPRCSTARQAELRFHVAALLAEQGQTDRAREHFRDVEALDPQGRYAAAAWRGARL